MSVLHKLTPFQNVGASLTAVNPAVPTGMVVEALLFKLGGTLTKALSTGIRIVWGGKKIVDITGNHMTDINEYYQYPTDAAFLPMWFADPAANNPADYLAGALDTSVSNAALSIEYDCGAGAGHTLELFGWLSFPQETVDRTKSLFRALIKTNHAPASATEHELTIPLGGGGALLRGVHYFHTNITKLQVLKDNFHLVQEGATAVLQFAQGLFRTAQAGMISYDPIYRNDIKDAVPTLRSARDGGGKATFQHKVTTSAADTIVSYSDILTTHSNF